MFCSAVSRCRPPRRRRWLVPGGYATIQGAINAAVNSDTVLVAPGLYYENITFLGKQIVVASQYLTTGNPAR